VITENVGGRAVDTLGTLAVGALREDVRDSLNVS
jgi:hypothetical protein